MLCPVHMQCPTNQPWCIDRNCINHMDHVEFRELEYEDVWAMFGEGRHPHIERLYETKLAPFLSQSANHFWQSRLWYFKRGLYYQGGMVSALSEPLS